MTAPALPPTIAELAAVAAFERDVREFGEPQARLRNTVTVAERNVTPYPAARPATLAASVARRMQ